LLRPLPEHEVGMTAEELLKNGDVKQALTELFAQVRAQPSDPKHRIFLFQLLCVAGQWDRALTQLNVAQELDPASGIMGKAYQEILHCEAIRRAVFEGTRTPLLFGEPQPWLAQLLEALRLDGKGQSDAANELRRKAFDEAPATPGTIQTLNRNVAPGSDPTLEETSFEWLADGDSRLGPVIEFIINGRYYWAPQHHIAEIVVEPPADLRDLVWVPAHFRWANAGEAVGVIPTRYVGSEASEDGAVQLARKTSWTEIGEEMYSGLGQRTFMSDAGDYNLLDVRRITFAPAES
jgi:type VI secretion system protein ImpE